MSERIEAAARAVAETITSGMPWEFLTTEDQAEYRDIARAALDAAEKATWRVVAESGRWSVYQGDALVETFRSKQTASTMARIGAALGYVGEPTG